MVEARLDVLMVVDPRFAGGTSAAVAADCRALVALGATVGLLPIASEFFREGEHLPNAEILDLQSLGVRTVAPGSRVRADCVFFHNPLVFQHGFRERAGLRAERAVVVAHHAPFRGDGSLEYDPLAVTWRVWRAFGVRPWWAPNSELTRRQLRSFAPAIRLTSEDWINLFDVSRWRPSRTAFSGATPTVGRHGRVDPLKWPDRGVDIAATLPAEEGWRVRVMGCPRRALEARGADLSRWETLDFNAEPPADFLNSLDLFSYFFSERLVESFGRTIVEAMLMERPCVLDPRLRAAFDGLAVFCRTAEAPAALARLRDDPAQARALASRAREACVRRYSAESMGERLRRLRSDHGVASRAGEKSASALIAVRKYLGHHRRAFWSVAP